jgi:hypothetical protein
MVSIKIVENGANVRNFAMFVVLWGMMRCSGVNRSCHFEGIRRLHLEGRGVLELVGP